MYVYRAIMHGLMEAQMQTKPKSNSIITHTVRELDDGNIEITFHVKDAGDVVLNTKHLHDDIMQRAAVHGLIQRISDAAAKSRDEVTGKPASTQEKRDSMADLVAYYHTGTKEWKRAGTGEGGGKSITIEAIARIKSISYEMATDYAERYAKAKFEGNTKKCLAFLRTGKQVMEAIAAIRAERQTAPVVDADAALDEMDAGA
jgi:hypothetical protein